MAAWPIKATRGLQLLCLPSCLELETVGADKYALIKRVPFNVSLRRLYYSKASPVSTRAAQTKPNTFGVNLKRVPFFYSVLTGLNRARTCRSLYSLNHKYHFTQTCWQCCWCQTQSPIWPRSTCCQQGKAEKLPQL